MRSLFIYVLLIVTVPVFAQDFDLFEKKEFTSKSGEVLPYRILYPENYDSKKKYPLVLFLHGAGERGDDNEQQLKHGVKIFLEAQNRKQFPCILIVPQCPIDSYWSSVKVDRSSRPLKFDFNYSYEISQGLRLAMALTKQTIKQESVDKKRVYITGLSMGGMGTFEAVYRFPKRFAAAVPVCGGADTDAYKKKHAKVPFRIFHGDADVVVPVGFSKAMHDKLVFLEAQVQYKEYPGVNHNSWDYAYAEKDLLPWLFRQKR